MLDSGQFRRFVKFGPANSTSRRDLVTPRSVAQVGSASSRVMPRHRSGARGLSTLRCLACGKRT